MRAVRVHQPGGPEALTVDEVDEPVAGPGEVVVEVAAAGVNFIDVYQRDGTYALPTPFVAGSEGAGRVVAVGEEAAAAPVVGDRVAWLMVPGAGYAERVVVPAERCVPVPDDVSDADAAAVMLQGVTVDYLTRSTYQVRAGDDVLVHAAAGGTGLLLVRAATALGARVVGTASTPEKCRAAEEAGAVATVQYGEGVDVAAEVRRLTGDRGVHVVYDGVGASTRRASLASLRRRGTYVLFGQASGAPDPVSGAELNKGGSLFFTRPTVVDHVVTREELLERTARVFEAVREGTMVVTVAATLPLGEAEQAHRMLQGRATSGKLLLDPRR